MALIKKFHPVLYRVCDLSPPGVTDKTTWWACVEDGEGATVGAEGDDVNRVIVETVAKMQAARSTSAQNSGQSVISQRQE